MSDDDKDDQWLKDRKESEKRVADRREGANEAMVFLRSVINDVEIDVTDRVSAAKAYLEHYRGAGRPADARPSYYQPPR